MTRKTTPGTLRIGIAGWTFPPWRGVFYPPKWPQKRELEYASRQLNSIELNGSFYSLQTPASYRAWHDATPDDFVFAVKGGQFITHMKRLRDIRMPLATFFASGVLLLKDKLGPILWQFPPNFAFPGAEERFDDFFALLPCSAGAAAKLAGEHDPRLKPDRVFLKSHKPSFKLRHAVEVRHESFQTPAFVKLLRKHDVAAVLADTSGKRPEFDAVTSDFIYLRLHGEEATYPTGYTDAALEDWAGRIAKLRKSPWGGLDVYVYFDIDHKVRSPANAMALSRRLGIAPPVTAADEAPRPRAKTRR